MLSIVVNLYNAEEYMEKCIDSLVSQTVQPDEILLVDDGSTDRSTEICDRYESEYEHIHTYHIPHMGLVAGRQFATKQAKEEYITFIDSDDWVTEGYVEDINRIINQYNPEMISYGFNMLFGDVSAKRIDGIPEGLYFREDIKKELNRIVDEEPFFTPLLTPPIVTKIFKKDLFKKYVDAVDTTIEKGEDAAVTLSMSYDVESIYVSHATYYQGISRKTSMSWEEDPKGYEKLIMLLRHLRTSAKYSDVYRKYLILLAYHYILDNLGCAPITYLSDRNKLPCWNDVKRGSRIIVYGKGIFANALKNIIEKSGFCTVVEDIDSGDAKEKLKKMSAEKTEYDKIVIAIADSKIVKSVKGLLLDIGIDDKRISCIEKNNLTVENMPEEIRNLFCLRKRDE